MKHILEYYKYIDNDINEGNFINWIIRSRKFGDLISLNKVTRLSKELAKLEYEFNIYSLELRNDRVSKGVPPDRVSQNELAKLQAMKNKEVQKKKQLELAIEGSEFLNYVSDLVKAEFRTTYADKLINLADENTEKEKYEKLYSIDKQHEVLLQKQLKLGSEYAGNYDDVDNAVEKKKKEERDELINRLNIQRLQLSNKEVEERTKSKYKDNTIQKQETPDINYEPNVY